MALPRSWSYPSQGTVITTTPTTVTETPGAGLPGFNLAADSIQVPVLITAPANSSSAASITFGTPIQNTLGYDAQIDVFVAVGAASVATFAQGVGSASIAGTGVVCQTLISNVTVSSAQIYSFGAYVPSSYWYQLNATQLNNASITASVNAQWQPV